MRKKNAHLLHSHTFESEWREEDMVEKVVDVSIFPPGD